MHATDERAGDRGLSIGGHTRGFAGTTDEWLTPPHIIRALGPFDLDPCSPVERPWDTAAAHYTVEDDGLARPWHGLVWCNPPYGPQTFAWMERLAEHGDGIALIFARTETAGFFDSCWRHATSMLFLRSRLHFHLPDGTRAPANSGGPSVLLAFGGRAHQRLRGSGLDGALVTGWGLTVEQPRLL